MKCFVFVCIGICVFQILICICNCWISHVNIFMNLKYFTSRTVIAQPIISVNIVTFIFNCVIGIILISRRHLEMIICIRNSCVNVEMFQWYILSAAPISWYIIANSFIVDVGHNQLVTGFKSVITFIIYRKRIYRHTFNVFIFVIHWHIFPVFR